MTSFTPKKYQQDPANGGGKAQRLSPGGAVALAADPQPGVLVGAVFDQRAGARDSRRRDRRIFCPIKGHRESGGCDPAAQRQAARAARAA